MDDVALDVSPAELLRRWPRRPGTFLLDGGTQDSWCAGEAHFGGEPNAIVELRADPPSTTAPPTADPFSFVEDALQTPPTAAVVCALAYDLGRWVERLGPGPRSGPGLPRLFAAAHPWLLVYSYREQRYTLRAPHLDVRERDAVRRRLEAAARSAPAGRAPGGAGPSEIASNFSRPGYHAAVRRILDYIAAGDVYQVNLAQRFTVRMELPFPADLFARLLAQHPAPYSAYVDGGAWSLISNSPECFLRRAGSEVSTYPIKGTRPRGAGIAEDKTMASDLLSSVKERAEHLMIVDLERNDLGRLCRYGSVHVPSFARLRTYGSLHHLESEVSGTLRPGTSLASLLRATFPGGSITGAPKVRAMQIIDELEDVGRGFYTGAIGLATPDEARLNVAIRTAEVGDGVVHYHSGGGIVADSDPDAEYEETRLKARAFFGALQARNE